MRIEEFIVNLRSSGLLLVKENDKLILKGNGRRLTQKEIHSISKDQGIISYIQDHKYELLEYVGSSERYSTTRRSENISSLYRLSALQEGMLFHGLYDGHGGGAPGGGVTGGGAYIEQFSCGLTGVDEVAFAGSWTCLLNRHSVLRSVFYYDAFSIPVQGVCREVTLPLTLLDYRGMSGEEQSEAVRAYEEADREKGFDFRTPPLMRVSLIRLSGDRYRMVWTHHHILFDGWSLQILVGEFLQAYELLVAGGEPAEVEEDRYEDYIRHIEGRDKEQEELYWRGYLEGIGTGSLLPFIRPGSERNKGGGEYREESLTLDQELTGRVESYAQGHRLTVSTVMQGVWSYLLHAYTGNRDIMYGVTVSGRPEGLAGVEQRVGLYINTLPLHSRLEGGQEVSEWLKELQEGQLKSREYQYTSLSEIQRWTGVQGDLFDSLLVFENYPVSKVISSRPWRLQVESPQLNNNNNYPLTLTISAGELIDMRFSYNTGMLEVGDVRRMRDHFEHVLRQVTGGEGLKLKDIGLVMQGEPLQLAGSPGFTLIDEESLFDFDKKI